MNKENVPTGTPRYVQVGMHRHVDMENYPLQEIEEFEETWYPKSEYTRLINALRIEKKYRVENEGNINDLLNISEPNGVYENYEELYENFMSKHYKYLDDIESDMYINEILKSEVFAEKDSDPDNMKKAKRQIKENLIAKIMERNQNYNSLLNRNLTEEEKKFIKENKLSRTTDQDIDEEDLPDLRGGNNNFLSFVNNPHRFYGVSQTY